MQERTSISVIIPAYNAAGLIGAAISSALSQSFAPEEILVVDDGSTDSTADIVSAYPSPVRLIRQANGGVSQARNAALREARGDFISFLDADDQFLPQHLELCWTKWRSYSRRLGHERLVVSGNAYRLTAHGLTRSTILNRGFPRPEVQRERILQENFVGIFALYPRSLHDAIGYFDPMLHRGEDRDLWTRALFSGWQIVPQPRPHALYRFSGASLTTAHDKMSTAESAVLTKTRESFAASLTPKEREYLDLRLASPAPRDLIHGANELIRTAAWRDAAELLNRAAELRPFDRKLRLRAWAARQRWVRDALTIHLRLSDRRLARVTEIENA